MTGTAKTEETEFEKTYKLETAIVPTNRVRARQDWVDQVYKTEDAKWRAVAKETAEIHQQGRPVLVGTTSVEKSELLSALLAEQNIPHNLLNAKPENVEREAEIVAQAGRLVPSPSPPTWPAAAPTSFSAATAITWPA